MTAADHPVADHPVAGSEYVFRGRILNLRVDQVGMPGGRVATREVVENIGAVGILALDEQDRVVLVNQYRHPIGRRIDELPAGLLDVEGEPAVAGARRELFEEAALRAGEWSVLLDLDTSPGFCDEAIRVFLARGLHEVPADERFEAEDEEATMTVRREPLEDCVRRVLAGELTNAAACAGILAAASARAAGWRGLRPVDAPWISRPGR